jgi:hypothetical protein
MEAKIYAQVQEKGGMSTLDERTRKARWVHMQTMSTLPRPWLMHCMVCMVVWSKRIDASCCCVLYLLLLLLLLLLQVRAVVLRINSPGGSAVASDMIAREIKLMREAGKPVRQQECRAQACLVVVWAVVHCGVACYNVLRSECT